MQIPILVESISGDLYRAEAPAPFCVHAEGKSSQEAVENLRAEIVREFSNGKRIMLLEVPLPDENPWVKFAGCMKDEPLLDDWRAAVAEYREERAPTDS
jgi:hypothetical protein